MSHAPETGCPACRPDLFALPNDDATDPAGHFHVRHLTRATAHLRAVCDGQVVPLAYESQAGPDGWVNRFVGAPPHEEPAGFCACGAKQLRVERRYGAVEFREVSQ